MCVIFVYVYVATIWWWIKMYIYNAELEDDGPNMMDDRTGRKMVLGWRLFGRSCRFSSPILFGQLLSMQLRIFPITLDHYKYILVSLAIRASGSGSRQRHALIVGLIFGADWVSCACTCIRSQNALFHRECHRVDWWSLYIISCQLSPRSTARRSFSVKNSLAALFIARQHPNACTARYCYDKSVRLSHAGIEMNAHIVKLFPPSGRGMTLVSWALPPLQNSKETPPRADKYMGWENFAIFDRNRHLSRKQYIRDRSLFTMDH